MTGEALKQPDGRAHFRVEVAALESQLATGDSQNDAFRRIERESLNAVIWNGDDVTVRLPQLDSKRAVADAAKPAEAAQIFGLRFVGGKPGFTGANISDTIRTTSRKPSVCKRNRSCSFSATRARRRSCSASAAIARRASRSARYAATPMLMRPAITKITIALT